MPFATSAITNALCRCLNWCNLMLITLLPFSVSIVSLKIDSFICNFTFEVEIIERYCKITMAANSSRNCSCNYGQIASHSIVHAIVAIY